MQAIQTKLQSAGFTTGHAKLLTVSFAIFAVLFFVKSDLSIRTLFAVADNDAKILTYDDVRRQVESEMGTPQTSNAAGEEIMKQIELLDRGGMDGAVLGEAIGIGAIPDADDLLLPELTANINFVSFPQDDSQSRIYYQTKTAQIENDASIISLLGALNSTDQAVLRDSVSGWQKVIDQLSAVAVPASLEKYHKAKVTYYAVLMNMGKVYAGDKSDSDMQVLTKAMLSYSQKVESLRAELNAKYGLSL